MNELATINNFCELGKTSLNFKRDITQDEWMYVFKALKQVEGCVQFWIGDCLAYRQQKWSMYEDIAEETGYDKQTLKNLKTISEKVPSTVRLPDLSFTHHAEVASLTPEKQELFLNKAVEEKLSVRELREKIRKDKHSDKIVKELPKGVYEIIYCDPPWRYDFAETDNRKIENQYPTMDIEEIKNLKLPHIAENALLLIWATAPKLIEALQVIESWGFKYKTHGIWDKCKIGMGYWFRGQHELLLVATRGNFSPPEPENRNSSIYSESREQHSNKPYFYYEWIEHSFGAKNKIELFSRNKRDGWESWGNE
jgi:N6-adenosine-specific RNA methylase IME4